MATSGITVSDDCFTSFNEMKMGHKTRYIIYKVTDDHQSIEIDEQGPKDKTFDDFKQTLFSKGEPRYACLDYEFVKEETGSKQDKLLFIFWCPDNAAVKKRMVYASSKDALRKGLQGIAKELQANDADDLDPQSINEVLSRK